MAIAGGDWTQKGLVIALLLVIMALNLLALLNVGLIFQYVSPTILLVVGWIMAVLQAALAAQYLINALVRLGVFPALGS
jgi:multiple antibiotic resistance protein